MEKTECLLPNIVCEMNSSFDKIICCSPGKIICYRVSLFRTLVYLMKHLDLQDDKINAESTQLLIKEITEVIKNPEKKTKGNELTVYTCQYTTRKYVRSAYDEPPFMVDSDCRDATYDDYFKYINLLAQMLINNEIGLKNQLIE